MDRYVKKGDEEEEEEEGRRKKKANRHIDTALVWLRAAFQLEADREAETRRRGRTHGAVQADRC